MRIAQRVGSRDSAIEVSCVGRPRTSRRTMFTGERTDSVDVDATLGEVERDLGAGVAHADDEHALAGEGRGVAVVAAVQHAAGEQLPVGERRELGTTLAPVATTTCGARTRARRRCAPASRLVAPHDGGDLGPEARSDPVLPRVRLEVVDDALARHVARQRAAGNGMPGSADCSLTVCRCRRS